MLIQLSWMHDRFLVNLIKIPSQKPAAECKRLLVLFVKSVCAQQITSGQIKAKPGWQWADEPLEGVPRSSVHVYLWSGWRWTLLTTADAAVRRILHLVKWENTSAFSFLFHWFTCSKWWIMSIFVLLQSAVWVGCAELQGVVVWDDQVNKVIKEEQVDHVWKNCGWNVCVHSGEFRRTRI